MDASSQREVKPGQRSAQRVAERYPPAARALERPKLEARRRAEEEGGAAGLGVVMTVGGRKVRRLRPELEQRALLVGVLLAASLLFAGIRTAGR